LKKFADLSEREILSVAIASEEEDNRIYLMFAEDLRERYPATAQTFEKMADAEAGHRDRLAALYRGRFGPDLVPIRRSDVKSFLWRQPVWLTRNLPLRVIRKEIEAREVESERFYVTAAEFAKDPAVKALLWDLAREEQVHEKVAANLEKKLETGEAGTAEAEEGKKRFILEYIQPGLVGLMDGSVSTLAPLFAAAFATHNNWDAFLVGMAASVGAGISMGFAEALADDGDLSGRGSPLIRGVVCGLMTTAGGLGHSMPYLVPDRLPNAFLIATVIAGAIVFCELWIIAFVRARYMQTPFFKAALQIVLGGAIVLATGILIGAS
jgi:erythrin-vacuolar iron transport family protein